MNINGIFIFITLSAILFVNTSATTIDVSKFLGKWNVVATSPLNVSFPNAQCWSVDFSKISASSFTGSTTYYDNDKKEMVKVSFFAQDTQNSFLSVFVPNVKDHAILKVSPFPIADNILEVMLFTDRSDYLGRLILSRNPVLPTVDDDLLKSQNIQPNVNNDAKCELLDKEVWNVVALSTGHFQIPKFCNWTVYWPKNSTTSYVGKSSYFNTETKQLVNYNFNGYADDSSPSFFRVSIVNNPLYPMIWVTKNPISTDLVEWTISHPDDSTTLGRFWVSRKSVLNQSEKDSMNSQGANTFPEINCSVQQS